MMSVDNSWPHRHLRPAGQIFKKKLAQDLIKFYHLLCTAAIGKLKTPGSFSHHDRTTSRGETQTALLRCREIFRLLFFFKLLVNGLSSVYLRFDNNKRLSYSQANSVLGSLLSFDRLSMTCVLQNTICYHFINVLTEKTVFYYFLVSNCVFELVDNNPFVRSLIPHWY